MHSIRIFSNKSDKIRPVSMHLRTPEDSDTGTEKFLSKIMLAQGIRYLEEYYSSLFGVKRNLCHKHPCNDVFSLMR